ncbi:hypothetical protein Tco_1528944 [Tanacetum coccineum]
MATEPNEVRRETLRRLRQELVADAKLANNLLHELNQYMDQLRTRDPELLRVEALLDDPLIKYGFRLSRGFRGPCASRLVNLEAEPRAKTAK